MTAIWKEIHLPTILSRYELKNVFNADEFGLFYQALANRSLHFKGKRCAGGKHSKVRFTGLAAGNAVGEKLPMFVISKISETLLFRWREKFAMSLSLSTKELDGWKLV